MGVRRRPRFRIRVLLRLWFESVDYRARPDTPRLGPGFGASVRATSLDEDRTSRDACRLPEKIRALACADHGTSARITPQSSGPLAAYARRGRSPRMLCGLS